MQGVFQQLQLQQDFLRNQGRKGFRFRGDSNDYPALLTKYKKQIENATSDAEQFKILYMLLEGDPEKMYNRHISTKDKSEALKNVWQSLGDSFGFRDHSQLVDIDGKSARSPVDSMTREFNIPLNNLCYCQDLASKEHASHLDTPSFLNNFIARLPPLFRKEHRSKSPATGENEHFWDI